MLPLPALQPPSLASSPHWGSWGQEVSQFRQPSQHWVGSHRVSFCPVSSLIDSLGSFAVLDNYTSGQAHLTATFYKEKCFSNISAKCENQHTFRIGTELLLPEIKGYTILYLGYLSKICWHSLHLPFYAFGFLRRDKVYYIQKRHCHIISSSIVVFFLEYNSAIALF